MNTAQYSRRPNLEAEARTRLLERRRRLSAAVATATREAGQLYEEREPDWEDRAANVAAANGLARLGESERAQLIDISAALDRMEAGAYGRCVACGRDIGEARLRAIPEAARCAACSRS